MKQIRTPQYFLIDEEILTYEQQLKRSLVTTTYFGEYLSYVYDDETVSDALESFNERFDYFMNQVETKEQHKMFFEVLQYSLISEEHSQIVLWLIEVVRKLKHIHFAILQISNINDVYDDDMFCVDLVVEKAYL